VVNPLFIKYVHGRKTVALESVWIAEIALNGMFKIIVHSLLGHLGIERTHENLQKAN